MENQLDAIGYEVVELSCHEDSFVELRGLAAAQWVEIRGLLGKSNRVDQFIRDVEEWATIIIRNPAFLNDRERIVLPGKYCVCSMTHGSATLIYYRHKRRIFVFWMGGLLCNDSSCELLKQPNSTALN